MSYDDGRAMLARSTPAPAPDDGAPSVLGRFALIFGAGLSTLLGWRAVEHAVHRRLNRPRPRLLDQYGRPIERRRR
jgi:hypothetical protein